MSKRHNPEDFPLQAGGDLPDLSMRNARRDGWETREDAMDANSSEQQSIFSKRSGIQDPLVRPESKPDEAPGETINAADAEVATRDGQIVEPDLNQPEGPEAPGPERKGRGGKARPRLVKSKRNLDRARRRQKNYLQERRDKKRLRVFFHRIKMILKLCFVALWCVLLWEAVRSPQWTFDQPRFSLTDAHLIQPTQLSPWVKQQVGKPIYAIDTGKLARNIKKNFDIANVVVVRRQMFPTRLDILIQEKQPWAEIYATDPNPKLTERVGSDEGVTTPAAKPVTKPLMKPIVHPYGLVVPTGIISLAPYHYQPSVAGGLQPEKLIVTPGTVFSLSYLERLRELIWQARQIKGLHLQSVDIRNPNRLVFNYDELPVVLGRMNNTAAERLSRLSSLIPKINEYREGMQSVDLQWEEQVTFHQKPNAKLGLPKPTAPQG